MRHKGTIIYQFAYTFKWQCLKNPKQIGLQSWMSAHRHRWYLLVMVRFADALEVKKLHPQIDSIKQTYIKLIENPTDNNLKAKQMEKILRKEATLLRIKKLKFAGRSTLLLDYNEELRMKICRLWKTRCWGSLENGLFKINKVLWLWKTQLSKCGMVLWL